MNNFKNNIMTLIIALICFICVIACDFILQKIPNNNLIGKLLTYNWIRMGISYFFVLTIFFIGLRLYIYSLP